jgi:hypothetical protein
MEPARRGDGCGDLDRRGRLRLRVLVVWQPPDGPFVTFYTLGDV